MRTELYKFTRGTDTWTFTSSDTAVTYDTDTYNPAVIGHNARESRPEISRGTLEVSLSLDNTLAQDIISYFGDDLLFLTLFIQTSAGTEVGWKGRYLNQQVERNQLKITIESLFTSLKRPGLRARYQKTCRHALYYTNCGVDQSLFAVSGTLTAINGSVITVTEAASQPDGYYTGGMVEELTNNSLRWIVNHVGSNLTLVRPFEALSAPGSVTIYPGCDHTRNTCYNKFNNVLNYGGFPWIPYINPMGGKSIV